MKKVNLASCITIAVAATFILPNDAVANKMKNLEKCYGVAKAGKNDCGSSNGTHSCAARSKKDGDKNEWLLVPNGLCNKLVGGSTVPGK
jgi:uncharacterized membrane protein